MVMENFMAKRYGFLSYYEVEMSKTKIALTLETDLLVRVDDLVAKQWFRNRSQAVEAALAEKLDRLVRTRLAGECARLDPAEEKRMAEEGFAGIGHLPHGKANSSLRLRDQRKICRN
jgi:Arc/MetJ-type ribon-helix-helix transcriptional regulator